MNILEKYSENPGLEYPRICVRCGKMKKKDATADKCAAMHFLHFSGEGVFRRLKITCEELNSSNYSE